MLPESIELVVVTPEKQLLRQSAKEVQLPGADGYLGVLPGHAPLITELGIGELSYHDMSGKESPHLAIIRGFAEVLGDRVTVLAETAEFAAEIDLARAEAALARFAAHRFLDGRDRLVAAGPTLFAASTEWTDRV